MEEIKIQKRELNALLFWALYGIQKARSGSYLKTLFITLKKYSKFANEDKKKLENAKEELGKYIKDY